VIVNFLGLDLHNLFVLLYGQLEHVVGTVAAARHVAQRPQINPAQQFVSLQIVRIAFENVLSLQHGVSNATSLHVQLGQSGSEELRRRISLDGQPVLFHGPIRQLTTAVNRNLLFVHMRERVVVIRGSAIRFARGSLGIRGLLCGLVRRSRRLGLRGSGRNEE
jgi:hypothetical protein